MKQDTTHWQALSSALLIMVLLSASFPYATPLTNLPLTSDATNATDFTQDAYTFLYRHLNQRHLPGITRGSLPLTRGQVAKSLLELRRLSDTGEIQLTRSDRERLGTLLVYFQHELPVGTLDRLRRSHMMELKGEDYRFAMDLGIAQGVISQSDVFTDSGTNYMTSLLPHVYGQVRDTFAFSTDIDYHFLYGDIFENLYPDDPSYTHFEGDLVNRVPMLAYLKFRLPWFDLEIGQDRLRWGPGYHGSLLLSGETTPMDLVKLQTSYQMVTFTAFTAILEDRDPAINTKYLSGHRIEGYLWDRWGLGFSEVIVYGNRFEPGYLNPVNVYLIEAINTELGDSRAVNVVGASGDNVLFTADSRLRPLDGLELYGELMIDDGNPAKSFHDWDTKFGILGGVYLTDPFGISDTDFHAEYAFINQYAYTHENPVNVYKHFSTVIGHPIGSDADDLWLELTHWFTSRFESSLTYELERHGEGNVNKSHPVDAPQDDTWMPLSGITQSEHQVTLRLRYSEIGRYAFSADISQIWLRNAENQRDVNRSGREVKLNALYRF